MSENFLLMQLERYPSTSNQILIYYTRGITPMRVTSAYHLGGLAPGQQSTEDAMQPWRHSVQFDRLPHR